MISNRKPVFLTLILTLCSTVAVATLNAQPKNKRANQAANQRAKQKTRQVYPAVIEGAKVEVYKTVGDVKLNAYTFLPDGHRAGDSRPTVVFFFGGGWKAGTPAQFEHQCRYLAARGMVAITVDYRVASRHQTKAVDCVSDAKSAIRWVRKNAERLGVDPNRIVAGGGSAGGHLAACTGTIKLYDEPSEDAKISSVPNAMALFNPALVLAPVEGEKIFRENLLKELPDRMGVKLELLSPYHQVTDGVPPTIIFHGKGDTTVAYRSAELFTEAMAKAGNRCELVGYAGQPHGFFNHGRGDENHFKQTLMAMDDFLVSLGYLEPKVSSNAKALLEK